MVNVFKFIILFFVVNTISFSYPTEKEVDEMVSNAMRDYLNSKITLEDRVISKYIDADLNLNNVLNAILDLEIKHPEWVFRQSIAESGWIDKYYYKSELANNGNNLFGMRKPNQRKTFALEKTMFGYATYEHWVYSIIDYKIWQSYRDISCDGDYGNYLIERNYALDNKKYINRLFSLKIPVKYFNVIENRYEC